MRYCIVILTLLLTSFLCKAQDLKIDILKDWHGNVSHMSLSENDTLILQDIKVPNNTKLISLYCRHAHGKKFVLFFHNEYSGAMDDFNIIKGIKWRVKRMKNNYLLKMTNSKFRYEYNLIPHYEGVVLKQIILIKRK